jgi:hypothetical protein
MAEHRCDCGHLESAHPEGGACTWKDDCAKFGIGTLRLSKSTDNSTAMFLWIGGAVGIFALLMMLQAR